jgi:hypothetical protein
MRAVVTFAIAVLFASAVMAQVAPSANSSAVSSAARRSKEAQMWLENANVLTKEIVDDGTANLPRFNDFVMNARLAEAWWKVDQKRARHFLDASVAIANDHKAETPVEGFKRLFVAVTVMQIATLLDHQRSDEVLDAILTQAVRLGPRAKSEDEMKARASFANLIEEQSGTYVQNSNLRRAKLFRALLNLGEGELSIPFLPEIYSSDTALGDELYSETLDAFANQNVPTTALRGLAGISIANPDIKVSPELKSRMLSLVTDSIVQGTANGITAESCRANSNLLTLVLYYPPETQTKVRPIAEQCKALATNEIDRIRIEGALQQKMGPDSPDELLSAAENEKDTQRRAEIKNGAAGVVSDSDPERALSILDGMTAEEKASVPWIEVARENIEQGAVVQFYRTRDFAALQRLIDHSPMPQKTALEIAKAAEKKDPAYAASLLQNIVDRLGEGRLNHSEFYLDVVNYVFKEAKPMTPVVFRDAMKGINSGVEEFIRGQTPPPPKGAFKRTSFWWQLEPAKLPGLLDVIDQRNARLSIDTLKFPMARTSMRLWLLRSELQAYDKATNGEKNWTKKLYHTGSSTN